MAVQAAGLAVYLAVLARAGNGPTPLDQALAERAAGLAEALERQVEGALARLSPVAQQVATDEPIDWRAFCRALDPDATRPDAGIVLGRRRSPRRTAPPTSCKAGATPSAASASAIPMAGAARGRRASAPGTFPIHMVDPPAANSGLLGLDLLSEPAVSEAIVRAGRSGLPQVLLPAALELAGADGPRLVILLPVARGAQLRGVLLAAVPLPAVPLAAFGPGNARAFADPTLGVRLAPWTSGPSAASRPPRPGATASARAPFYVRGQPWAVEIAARRL